VKALAGTLLEAVAEAIWTAVPPWQDASDATPFETATAEQRETALAEARAAIEVVRAALEVLERELILQALERARGNKSRAARLLGLTRRTLYSRMERHGLRKPGEGDEPAEGEGDAPAGAGEERA